MKLGKVVGTVVLSQCIEAYQGRSLHLVMELDENLQTVGTAEVCATWEAVSYTHLTLPTTPYV